MGEWKVVVGGAMEQATTDEATTPVRIEDRREHLSHRTCHQESFSSNGTSVGESSLCVSFFFEWRTMMPVPSHGRSASNKE